MPRFIEVTTVETNPKKVTVRVDAIVMVWPPESAKHGAVVEVDRGGEKAFRLIIAEEYDTVRKLLGLAAAA
jgi:hypothetical protein